MAPNVKVQTPVPAPELVDDPADEVDDPTPLEAEVMMVAEDDPVMLETLLEADELRLVPTVLLPDVLVDTPLFPLLPPLPPFPPLLMEDEELMDDVEPPLFPLVIDDELIYDMDIDDE